MANIVAAHRLGFRAGVAVLRRLRASAVVITVGILVRRPMVVGVCASGGVMAVPQPRSNSDGGRQRHDTGCAEEDYRADEAWYVLAL